VTGRIKGRSPRQIIADYSNVQHTAHTFSLTDEQERLISDIMQRYCPTVSDAKKAYNAIVLAINSARAQSNMAKISEGERKMVFEEIARRADAMLEFIDLTFINGRPTGGSAFYADLVGEGLPDQSIESFHADPLFTDKALLIDRLKIMRDRAQAIAERIEPREFIRNPAHHVLAAQLIAGCNSGDLPITPSKAGESRFANLFKDCCQIAGLDPVENLSPYIPM
jgi:hypothetical protein